MDKSTRLSAEQRENLVAYLDGELEDAASRDIDAVLSRSEVARHEVEALARTWELLDLLERPNATQNFTERTLTTLKLSEVQTRLVDQPWFKYVRQAGVIAVWAVGLAACAALGFAATNWGLRDPHDALITQLPLVRDVDVYLELESLEYVKELQRSGEFSGAALDDQPSAPRVAAAIGAGNASYRQNADLVVKMTARERERVQRNFQKFQELPPDRQQQVRALHDALAKEPENVWALVNTYAVWLQTLTPGQRDDLHRAATVPAKMELVRKYKAAQDADRETQAFDLNLDLARMKPRPPAMPHLAGPELAAVMAAVEKLLSGEDQRRISRLPAGSVQRDAETIMSAVKFYRDIPRFLSPENLESIIEALSDEQTKKIVRSAPIEGQRMRVMALVLTGIWAKAVTELGQLFPTEAQLEEVFVKLDSESREKLLELPPDQLTRNLVEKYFEQQADREKVQSLRKVGEQMRGFIEGMRPRNPNGFAPTDRLFPRNFTGRPLRPAPEDAGAPKRPGDRPRASETPAAPAPAEQPSIKF